MTGATGNLGSAIVHKLASAGAVTALIARNARRLERLKAHLPEGARACVQPADVTRAYEVVEARDQVLEKVGPPDLLVIAAGVRRAAPFEEAIPADWDAMLSVNVKGLMQTVQIFAPDILAAADQGRKADVVLLSSGIARERQSAYSVFSSISATVRQLAKHLRAEFGPRGVRVHHLANLFSSDIYDPTDLASNHHDWITDQLEADMENAISPTRVADTIDLMLALPARANLARATVQPTRTR
ncbi:MAG: SDR family NAD(P)-dependent oxidoreductase [Propionibacteriaceae bacterium]|nr:SDR family NAD(P)-dependent oxidoreductase [Propionibacteriaceae bacterium]